MKTVKTASIRNPRKPPMPPVTFKAASDGLHIRIKLPSDIVGKIEQRMKAGSRVKAKASRSILEAIDLPEGPSKRERRSTLQADIPRTLRGELASIARGQGRDMTMLVADLLSEWVDPKTGKVKNKVRRLGGVLRSSPRNFRTYSQVPIAQAMCKEARKGGASAMARLQIGLYPRVAKTIRSELASARISKAAFLTAMALEIRDRHHRSAGESTVR